MVYRSIPIYLLSISLDNAGKKLNSLNIVSFILFALKVAGWILDIGPTILYIPTIFDLMIACTIQFGWHGHIIIDR